MRDPFSAVDPLAEVLHFVRVTGTFYCRSELSAPWGLFMPPMPGCAWFHVAVTGAGVIDVAGCEPTVLGEGSFVLVPHGRGHHIRSGKRVAAPNVVELPQELVSERYSLLRHGGGGAPTTLVCGVVRLDAPVGLALEGTLPPVLHVEASRLPDADWMLATLRLMGEETRALRPGGETVVTRLADVLVVHAIRAWLERDPLARAGWLGALRDPQVGRALAAVWRAPSEPWSVERMAKRAAMSRSGFATRFVELVGEPPMEHVTRVRMQIAGAALREGHATLAEIAGRMGYRSQAAFSRAFKRVVGRSPSSLSD